MNLRFDHDMADALAGALAFGALEPAEERAVLEHLLTCDQPHAELRTALGAGIVLASTLEPLPASSALRSRILQAVASSEPAAAAPRRVTRSWLSRALPALAAVVVVALLAWNVNLQNQLANREQQLNRLVAAIAGGQTAYLASGPAGTGYLINSEVPVLVASLQATPAGQLYEMWLIDANGVPVSVGTFTVTSPDDPAIVQLEQATGGYTIFALTVEQERVEAPTSDPVLVAPLGS